jgi:hypothetical protein
MNSTYVLKRKIKEQENLLKLNELLLRREVTRNDAVRVAELQLHRQLVKSELISSFKQFFLQGGKN